jgi:MinD-like ATPase involved in chromosome partitioning or flagellar assembly
MGTIAFASAKGSPGVTTTVAALAATWPDDRDLHVVELDPSGGDLVVRFDLALEPGLVTLAAAGRRELGPDLFVSHTQVLPSDAGGDDRPVRRVLPAPVAAEQAGAALAAVRTGLSRVLRSLDGDVLIDCGRLDPTSPAVDAAIEADLLVMVARPVVAEVHHLAARLASLRPRALSLLLIGDRPYSVSDVAGAVGATPLGTLPVDSRAASVLTVGHPNALKVLRRSRLLRDARAVAEGLADWLGSPAGTTPPTTTAPPPATAAPPAPPPPPPTPPPPTRPWLPEPPPERAPTTPLPPPPPPGYPPRAVPDSPDPRAGTNGHGNGTDGPTGPKHFRRSGEGADR